MTASANPNGNSPISASRAFASSGDGPASFAQFSLAVQLCEQGTDCADLPADYYGVAGDPIVSGTPADVFVVVENNQGAGVAGVLLTFSLEGDFGRLLQTTALTDANGEAVVQLAAGVNAGSATVTVSANPDGNTPLNRRISFVTDGGDEPVPYIFTMTQLCNAALPAACAQIGQAGNAINGANNGYARATLTDDLGAPIVGRLVTFTLGNAVGTLITSSAITNGSGIAEGVVGAGAVQGAGSVIASVTPAAGVTLTQTVNFASAGDAPEEPPLYTVSVDVCDAAVIVNGVAEVCAPRGNTPLTSGTPSYAWATVQDKQGVEQSGVVVVFSLANSFGVLAQTTALTDGGGQASVQLLPGDSFGAGLVVATVSIAGDDYQGSKGFATDGTGQPAPYSLTLIICDASDDITCSGSAVYGTADNVLKDDASNGPGASTGNGFVHARLLDSSLDPVGGAIVQFSLVNNVGSLITETALTNGSGLAIVQLSPGDVKGAGSVSASATVNGVAVSNAINFASAGDDEEENQTEYTILAQVCTLAATTVVPDVCIETAKQASPIPLNGSRFAWATITDSDNDPVADVIVTFSLLNSIGSLTQTTALTNAAGRAFVNLGAGGSAGAGALIATANPNGQGTITDSYTFQTMGGGSVTPYSISASILTAYPAGVPHGGHSSPITNAAAGYVVANVTQNAVPLENELVSFTLSNDVGVLVASAALTDGNGNAVVRLNAGTVTGAGTATVSVDLGGATYTANVNFATSVTPPSPDVISLGVLWSHVGVCIDNDDDGAKDVPIPGYTPMAIYVGDKGNLDRATTSACQVSGTDSFNTMDGGIKRELKTGVTATIRVHVYNEDQSTLHTSPVEVTFSSLCSELEKATLGSASSTTTTVTAVGGIATTTYLADGCVGQDTITAIATVGTEELAAQVTFDIEIPDVNSIEFVSAEPKVLALKGTGGANRVETSVVKFRVVGSDGNPSENRDVYLSLYNAPGGAKLDTDLATSNADGIVEVTVSSGTVPGILKVRARYDVLGNEPDMDDDVVVLSDALSVSSGIPDQNGITLFATILNPEAWNHHNETVKITAALNDRTGENVAVGTAVYFRTELGRIGGDEGHAVCYTDITGSCSVNWFSNGDQAVPYLHYDPTPGGGLGVPGFSPGFDRRGRNVIYAYTQGEETFIDANGNNVFDDGIDTWRDQGEVYFDFNENGDRDTGNGVSSYLEPYVEYNGDGIFDGPDSFFNGLTCSAASITAGHCAGLVNVYSSITMSVSTNKPRIYMSIDPDDLTYTNYTDGVNGFPDWSTGLGAGPQDSYEYTNNQTQATLHFLITDQNGNAMPYGTTVTAEVTEDYEIIGPSSVTIGSSSLESRYSFGIKFDEEKEKAGTVTLVVATPKGSGDSEKFTFYPPSDPVAECHVVGFTSTSFAGDEDTLGTIAVEISVINPVMGCTSPITLNYFVTGHAPGNKEVTSPVSPVGTLVLNSGNAYTTTVEFTVTPNAIFEMPKTIVMFIGLATGSEGEVDGSRNSFTLTINNDD